MADNTKIWPIFRWANWWLSDDLFTGIRNSFYFSNDMEVRQDAKSAFPAWCPAYADTDIANVSLDVWDGSSWKRDVVCVTEWANDWWWIVCLKKTIYLVNFNIWTVTELCTMNEEICDMEVFNEYIYIATKNYLYYKKDNWYYWTDMAAATNDTDDDYGRCSTALQANSNHPLYATDICLCVWDENHLRKVTKETPSLLEDWFEIQKSYYIRFIWELWWFVRVIAVDEPYWSEVLLWDKVSDAPEEIIPLEWYSMLWSAIYNWYHYLLSNKWLGLLNWYQYYLLKKAEWDLETTVRNCMCVYDDKLYFVTKWWIYIYWAKNKNYADVLTLWHKPEDGYKLCAIGASKHWIVVTRSGKNMWSGTDIPVRVGINNWTPTVWELQTMCYYWTSLSEIKQSEYLRVWYHIPKEWSASGNVKVYYRTEADAIDNDPNNWSWHELTPAGWLTSESNMRSPFATTLKLNCRFQWIQFKFVLTNCVYTSWWVKYSKDTNLYSADLYYNVMLD